SNAIVYAREGQTVGVGAGQMSRVDSAKIGAMKAQLPLKGTVVASDAFFPFPDGVEEIAKAGATAVIQPGGSQRDPEVIEAADRARSSVGVYRRRPLPALKSRRQASAKNVAVIGESGFLRRASTSFDCLYTVKFCSPDPCRLKPDACFPAGPCPSGSMRFF